MPLLSCTSVFVISTEKFVLVVHVTVKTAVPYMSDLALALEQGVLCKQEQVKTHKVCVRATFTVDDVYLVRTTMRSAVDTIGAVCNDFLGQVEQLVNKTYETSVTNSDPACPRLTQTMRNYCVPASPPPARTMALTAENRRELATLASSSSLGKMPKPPPGYKQNRTKGFPLADLDALFGHVLNALGPELATTKNQLPPESSSANKEEAVGTKRARGSAGDGGGGKRRSGDAVNGRVESGGASSLGQGSSPMEVDAAGGKDVKLRKTKSGAVVKTEVEPKPGQPSDPVQEGLQTSKKAFSRVLGVWEGVAMEGKRGLHQRVVARLGRILVEAEAAALAQGTKTSRSEVRSINLCQYEVLRGQSLIRRQESGLSTLLAG